MTSQKLRMADVFKLPVYASFGNLRDNNDRLVARALSDAAEAIALAANAHDKMREALEYIIPFIERLPLDCMGMVQHDKREWPVRDEWLSNARAALAEDR